jgi:hypothetical protein
VVAGESEVIMNESLSGIVSVFHHHNTKLGGLQKKRNFFANRPIFIQINRQRYL